MDLKKKKKESTLEDKLKYEIAEELGLMDKINQVGWGGLTAKESGRIGGLITVRKKELKKKKGK
ncbi:MAG: small, acid-soluble spore protein, alpha/beta type [Tissierellia bacterium]|nr:small, acid-soluble spore protein, alpha/beta type [Tissierellia bacterium]